MKQNEILHIDIESTDLEERQKKSGDGRYFIQLGYAHLVGRDGSPSRYPTEFNIMVPDGEKAYEVGTYFISPRSFRVNQWGQLELGFLNLVRPLTNQPAKAQQAS